MFSSSPKAPYYKRLLFKKLTNRLHTLSWLAFLIGFVWFLIWPLLTKNTYFSENALGVAQYNFMFTVEDLEWAEKQTRKFDFNMDQVVILSYLTQSLHTIEMETKLHRYQVQRSYFNQTVLVSGVNLYATLRASKGSGKESIVLRVPFTRNEQKFVENMQMGLALMRCFSRAKWLHHDLIFVVVDQTDKQWAGDEAFMTSQEIPTGKKREAILLDFDTFNFHSLGILTEGFNGELPNLDLVNTAVRLAQYNGVESISLFKYDHHSDNPRLNIPYPVYLYYRLLTFIREFVSKLFGIPKNRIIEDRILDKSITIMHHAYNQLIGLGTGGHSWYRKYSTHAITLTNANGKAVVSKGRRFNMIAIGKVVEGIVRSMNNLIEELHQSFFLYFMDSTMTYYGFEHYMPDLLALIAPIIFQFIGNYYLSEQKQLIHSLAYFVVTLLAGGIIYIVPYSLQTLILIEAVPAHIFFAIWIMSIVVIMFLLFMAIYPLVDRVYIHILRNNEVEQKRLCVEWRTVKAFTMSYCCIILGVLLVLESAACIVTAIYLFVLSVILTNVHNVGISKWVQLIFLLIVSPFNLVALLTVGYLYNLHGMNISKWTETFDFILSQKLINVHTNIVFISLCFVFIPVWQVFIKLVLLAIQKRVLISKQKLD